MIMPNNWFKFKQFTVMQDRCAMKVGTDGVLLGSWCNTGNCRTILDAGAGTGLIALMCAQRSQAMITGIEVNTEASEQAGENFRNSPWRSRLRIIAGDIRKTELFGGEKFDMVVSNPPYYKDSVPSKKFERSIARHSAGINMDELIDSIIKILAHDGRISMILPLSRFGEVNAELNKSGFYTERIARVASRPGDSNIRLMAEWSNKLTDLEESQIYVYREGTTQWHSTYQELTSDFYL
jgi:tRNA1Val (adenine37-N6)-methyltransferase